MSDFLKFHQKFTLFRPNTSGQVWVATVTVVLMHVFLTAFFSFLLVFSYSATLYEMYTWLFLDCSGTTWLNFSQPLLWHSILLVFIFMTVWCILNHCMPPCLLHRMQCFASRFFSVGMPSANTTALHLSELLGFTLTFYRAIPSHCKSYPWCIQVLLKSSEHLGWQFSSLFLLFLPCARTHTCKTEHPRLIPSNGPAFLVSLVVGKWLLYSWTTRAK